MERRSSGDEALFGTTGLASSKKCTNQTHWDFQWCFIGDSPARTKEQTLLEFDGSSLLTAENPTGALDDIQALLQPNTDKYYFETIKTIEDHFSDTPEKSKRLFLLMNPLWRDKSSWGMFDSAKAESETLEVSCHICHRSVCFARPQSRCAAKLAK